MLSIYSNNCRFEPAKWALCNDLVSIFNNAQINILYVHKKCLKHPNLSLWSTLSMGYVQNSRSGCICMSSFWGLTEKHWIWLFVDICLYGLQTEWYRQWAASPAIQWGLNLTTVGRFFSLKVGNEHLPYILPLKTLLIASIICIVIIVIITN